MQIRPLQAGDREGLLMLLDRSYDEVKEDPDLGEYLRLNRPSRISGVQWFRNLYNVLIKSGDAIYYIAVDQDKVVGLCYTMKKSIPDSEMSHVGTLGIRIAKNWRDKGVGTRLVDKVLKESRGKFEIIEVDVMSINKASKALFKKFGFRRWGTAPDYVKRGRRYIDMEYMYLRL